MPIGLVGVPAKSIIDAEFGPLAWDEQLKYWQGRLRISAGAEIELVIFARDLPLGAIAGESRDAFRRLTGMDQACRAYAADKLLEICNEAWVEGPPLTREAFMGRMAPVSLEIHESGYAELHYGDGDMFWGHGIGVRIRPDGSFQEAVVEG